MKRKISYVVLLGEVCAIIILHIAKYKREQPAEIVKSSYNTQLEISKNTPSSTAIVAKMKY